MFWGWLWAKMFFNGFFRRICKQHLCSEGKNRAFSLTLSVFGKCHFLYHTKSPNTTKNRGFRNTRKKPKMALLVAKVPVWEGASKRGFTICDTQKLCSAESTIYSVFSKHSFAEVKECKLKQNRNLPKIGGCLPTFKKVFLLLFLGFWVVSFFPVCFCSFVV